MTEKIKSTVFTKSKLVYLDKSINLDGWFWLCTYEILIPKFESPYLKTPSKRSQSEIFKPVKLSWMFVTHQFLQFMLDLFSKQPFLSGLFCGWVLICIAQLRPSEITLNVVNYLSMLWISILVIPVWVYQRSNLFTSRFLCW